MKKMRDTLQHTATHCNTLPHTATHCNTLQHSCDLYGGVASGLSRTQNRHPPVCCIVLQSVAECCRVLQCVAVCCSGLQCVAVCCSVLQCVTLCYNVSFAHKKSASTCQSDKTPLSERNLFRHYTGLNYQK